MKPKEGMRVDGGAVVEEVNEAVSTECSNMEIELVDLISQAGKDAKQDTLLREIKLARKDSDTAGKNAIPDPPESKRRLTINVSHKLGDMLNNSLTETLTSLSDQSPTSSEYKDHRKRSVVSAARIEVSNGSKRSERLKKRFQGSMSTEGGLEVL